MFVVPLALLLAASVADAGTPDAGARDAGRVDAGSVEAQAPVDGGLPPEAVQRAADVRALVAGTLEVAIDPTQLFDVNLADEAAVQLERVRLGALLRSVSAPDGGLLAFSKDAGQLDVERWAQRLQLDRARLAFYSLTPEARAALLESHAARREAAKPRETEAQRRAREAEVARQEALREARAARSEAERLVNEEVARLIGVERDVLALQEGFRERREALALRKDSLLGWQRRVRDARAGAAEADATYDALRGALRSVRDALEAALEVTTTSEVPAAGPDPLLELPSEFPVGEARDRRARVERLIVEATDEERELKDAVAASLLDEMNALNRERLGLLEDLSARKRSAITGFTDEGFDQARAEARHLVLTLRSHQRVATDWLRSGGSGMARVSALSVAAVLVPWLLITLAFIWWRRRSPAFVTLIARRLSEQDRAERLPTPSVQTRGFRFFAAVRKPLEWLLFFWVLELLLPGPASALLEVQLLTVIVSWSLGGSFVVDAINALAAVTDAGRFRTWDEGGELRLRSLRLVGRVVIGFVLTLVITSRLVGEGTVFSWVLASSWFAVIPVFLVLVRWWSESVFARVERLRKKTRLQTWMLANREGWIRFVAASIAVVQLFALGAYKAFRNRLASFEVARRALAWLFKRELDRRAEEDPKHQLVPLNAAALASLAPSRAWAAWLPCPADEHVAAISTLVTSGDGGVVAVVGGRGLGKSSLLARLAALHPGALVVRGHAQLTVETLSQAVGAGPLPRLVVVDDASACLKPVLGGLKAFDEVLAFTRTHTRGTLWVLALDGAVWPFLRRARDARPLFDELFQLEGWTDEQIGALLSSRSTEAGLTPDFHDLVDALPPTADEIDRQEALDARRTGYFRMMWDHSSGNPGVALEAWRRSLGEASGSVRVRHLQLPPSTLLERLPDAAVFILRAVLQMPPARLEDIAQATRLAPTHVQAALRFGVEHGYLVEVGEGYEVSWTWLRAVVLFLERRHLLVNS